MMKKSSLQDAVHLYAPLATAAMSGEDMKALINNDTFWNMLLAVQATVKERRRKVRNISEDTEGGMLFALGYLAAKQGWFNETKDLSAASGISDT